LLNQLAKTLTLAKVETKKKTTLLSDGIQAAVDFTLDIYLQIFEEGVWDLK